MGGRTTTPDRPEKQPAAVQFLGAGGMRQKQPERFEIIEVQASIERVRAGDDGSGFEQKRRANRLVQGVIERLPVVRIGARREEPPRAEGFDPRLDPQDEPDWDNPRKIYSPAVLAEQERIARNDALAFVFPVWWWSLPATTKGWIDRVWNHGWAYGDRKFPHRKAVLLAVCSSDAEQYAKRRYDDAMRTQLVTGIIDYCGIRDGALEYLHGSLASEEIRRGLLDRAAEIGRTF